MDAAAPRRAAQLSVNRSLFRGRVRYVVSAPLAGAHISLNPESYRLLQRIDGETSLDDLIADPAPGLPPPALREHVLQRLVAARLVELPGQPAAPRPTGPAEGRILFFRRELVDIAPLMPVVNRLFGWMFTRGGLIAFGLVVLVALLRFLDGRADSQPFAWLSQLAAGEALMLWLFFLLLKGAHELGHGLALWRMSAAEGRAVQSIRAGLMVMLVMPFPFTDVSAAWKLSSKWRRAAIGCAGMYVEIWIAALALLLWSFTSSEVLRTICIQVATVAGVTTLLFNLNPLGRMDGYYVLGDLAERPNLLGQASQAANAFAARLFRVSPQAAATPPDWPMLLYWLGGYSYRVLVFVGMAWLVHDFAPALSIVILLIAFSLLIVRPVHATARTLIAMAPEPSPVKRKLWISAAVAAAVALFLPLPAGVPASGLVELPASTLIYAPRDARLLAVAPAGRAAANTPLLLLESPDATEDRAIAAARREAAVITWRRAADTGAGGTQSAAEQVQRLDTQLAALDNEVARLETVSEAPGRFDPLDSSSYAGGWVSIARDKPLAVLQREGPARLHLLVAEDRIGSISPGDRVTARIWGRPGQFRATVERVGERIVDLPSAALGRGAGGSIETRPDDPKGKAAVASHVEFWARPDADAPPLFMGQRIEARIGQPPRPLAWQLGAAALRLLDVRAQRQDG
ncbi:hypothetical protein [Sandaracinobacteroides hominis]|uniref:hypothetical protein n=1 Tax=Sandaracinobacteroides hominis TaxID=2780086 RepID=UPI0018F71BCA|nr:hypothetical protein [Sandaracinobacteroides hominis]